MSRKFGILLAVYISALAINLDITIVNVALPSIAEELDASTRGLQWVVDGYTLTFAALVLAAGSLSDRYGRRPALLIGLLGFAVTSGMGALATSTWIAKSDNVILLGPPGVGKTHLAIALGIKAAHNAYPVLFDTTTGWVTRLEVPPEP